MFYSLWRLSLSSPVKVFFAILCLCSVIFWGLGLGLGKLIIFWSFGDNEKITEVCKLEKSGFCEESRLAKEVMNETKWWFCLDGMLVPITQPLSISFFEFFKTVFVTITKGEAFLIEVEFLQFLSGWHPENCRWTKKSFCFVVHRKVFVIEMYRTLKTAFTLLYYWNQNGFVFLAFQCFS